MDFFQEKKMAKMKQQLVSLRETQIVEDIASSFPKFFLLGALKSCVKGRKTIERWSTASQTKRE